MRIVIAEDEPVAREALRLRLLREPDVEIVGEAGSGEEAIRVILDQLPDAVFLDVQMPPPDGFGVLRAVAETHLPAVVFVTAFDQYALSAFDVHALDYLLKPIDQERVQRALARVRKTIGREADQALDRLVRFLERDAGGPGAEREPPLQRLVVHTAGRHRLLDVETIDWIESAGNYVEIHAAGGKHLLRATLQDLQRRLRARGFERVHRRILVNVASILEMRPVSHGDYEIVLRNGSRLPMSRTYRSNLLP